MDRFTKEEMILEILGYETAWDALIPHLEAYEMEKQMDYIIQEYDLEQYFDEEEE